MCTVHLPSICTNCIQISCSLLHAVDLNRSTIDCFCIFGFTKNQKDSLKRKSKSFIIRDDALFFKDAKKGVELKVS